MIKMRYMYIMVLAVFFSVSVLQAQERWFEAVSEGNIRALRSEMRNGININKTDTFARSALIIAAGEGDLRTVRFLLRRGAEVDLQNYFGETALMVASEGGHVRVVRQLLRRGASVEITDIRGWNALMVTNTTSICRILISKNIDIDHQSDAQEATALMVSAERGNASIVQLLLDAGADKEVRSKAGKRAVEYAIKSGNKRVVDLLTDE